MTDINEQAFWRACEPLKEEGMNISNYLDQLSGVLFLKACDASGKVTFADIRENGLELPSEYRWDSIIRENDSEERLEKYNEAIEYLKHNNGEVSREAFKGFTPQFDRAATFSRTVDIIENIDGWENYDQNADVFGDAHEYLLEKYVDKAEGAGEYFTPRHLVNTMVRVTDPEVGENIIDPAAGTNGFLVSSYNHMKKNTDDFDEAGESVEYKLHSREIQRKTYRLGLMKYILHDIDPVAVDSMCEDSLRGEGNREEKYDVVLANPPFGPEVTTKYDPRCDSKIETNFLMMMIELLDQGGRAAIVVPEGILFDGAKEVVRKKLLNYCNLDTILALPKDTFQPYAGVDANVLFFEKDNDGTDNFWFYDARSDYENIKEENTLEIEKHFVDLIENYDSDGDREEVDEENHELHLKKYKEFKYGGHRPPAEIAQDIKTELATIENSYKSYLSSGIDVGSSKVLKGVPEEDTLQDGWNLSPLSEVAEINPRSSYNELDKYAYLPMSAVSAKTQSVERFERRDSVYSSLARFEKGDILFARITPCFENGKIAVVPELPDGYKFAVGSSEFAVIRPNNIDTDYLHMYLTSPVVKEWGENRLVGSTGRERIQVTQIRNELNIPVPPIEKQKEIVNEVRKTDFSKVSKAVSDLDSHFDEYRSSILAHAFRGDIDY